MSNIVTETMKKELLNLKVVDLTISNIINLFGNTTKKESGKFVTIPPKYKTSAKMHLSANEYINKKDIDTNVGIFLFNKLLIEGKLTGIIPDGYFNEVLDKKNMNNLISIISDSLMKKKIKVNPTLVRFLKDYEVYSLKLSSVFSPSYTLGMIKPNEKLMKEKEEMLKSASIKDVSDMAKIENELIDKALKELENDPGMSLFSSGARGSFGNDYKNMNLMVGPSLNPTTGKFDFITSNFTNGLQKEDLVAAGNIIVTSSYPKAIGTGVGGYMSKIFYSLFQSIVVDKPGTDCGTEICLDVYLTKENLEMFLYQNIKLSSGKLETLTTDNYQKFINKTVSVRSPMFCLTDNICATCTGKRFELLNLENIGLTTPRISNTLMNLNLKKKHSTKITLNEVNIDSLII